MRQEFSFLSKDGRTKVYAVRRVPEGKPIGVVQLVHGMVEYIGRYTEFADFLEENGFVAVGHDHVGHGHSVVSDEELGFFREKNPDGLLVDDMETLYRMTREDYPDLPYFILGHSLLYVRSQHGLLPSAGVPRGEEGGLCGGHHHGHRFCAGGDDKHGAFHRSSP